MEDYEREAHNMYDSDEVEEGEIVEDEEDISALDGFNFNNNSFYNNFKELETGPTRSDHSNIPKYDYRDSKYLSDNYSAGRDYYEEEQAPHPYSQLRQNESRPVKKYKSVGGNKLCEKSKSPSSSSSESSCSCLCSSCSNSSDTASSAPSSPLPSRPKDGQRYSKSSNKPSHERKEPALRQRYSPRNENCVKSTIHIPSKPASKKKNLSDFNKSLRDKTYKHNQRFERRPKSTAVFKSTTSGSSKVVKRSPSRTNRKRFRSPVKSKKVPSVYSSSNKDLPITNSLTEVKDSLTSKFVPGSLGEMLVHNFKNEATLASKLSIFNEKDINCKDNNQKETPKCEIVDLCHEEDDDELALRIKALESAVKCRQWNQTGDASSLRTWSTLPEDWNDSALKSLKLGENMINFPDGSPSPKIDFENDVEHNAEEKVEEVIKEENLIDIEELEVYVIEQKSTGIPHQSPLIEFHANETNLIEEESDEISNKNESFVAPCELTSVDMDISNDSFGDSVDKAESNEIITGENSSEAVNSELQHSNEVANFSIPIEWAYMMPPPPQPDQPDNNLSSIKDWCFNQNMFVQSMQTSIKDASSQPTWNPVEADKTTAVTESYNNFPPTTQGNTVQGDDFSNDQNDCYNYDCRQFGGSNQPIELRDSHAEQYKSFMSSVMTHNCQSLGNKKEPHRDLVEIQLEPSVQTVKNTVEKKSNALKRRGRRRRRSSKRNDNGGTAITNVLKENENSENKNVVDEEDEDMLRALLLNDMTLKYKNSPQELSSSLDCQDSRSNSSGSDISTKKKSSKPITKSTLLPQNRFKKVAGYNKEPKNNWLAERKLPNVTVVKRVSDEPKTIPFSMMKFPPVKPVIISFNNDSDSDEESEEEIYASRFRNSDSILSGIDSLIRSCRNKQSMSSSLKDNSPSRNLLPKKKSLVPSSQSFVSRMDEEQPKSGKPVLHTPKGVTHLSKEKQLEYRRLKQLMISKKKDLQMKNKRSQCSKSISLSHEEKENISLVNQVVEQGRKEDKGDVCSSSPEDIQTSSPVDAQVKVVEDNQSTKNDDLNKSIFYTLKSFVSKSDIFSVTCKPETDQNSTVEDKIIQGHNEITATLETVDEKVEEQKENINTKSSIPVTESADIIEDSSKVIIEDSTSPATDAMPIMDKPESPVKISAETSKLLTKELDTDVEENVGISKDTSDEDSSSSESESSSSSSEDSESESEEDKTEISLRNRLLQKRRELLLVKNNHPENEETSAQKLSDELDDKAWNCDSNLEKVESLASAGVSSPENITEPLQGKDTSEIKSNFDIEADNKNVELKVEKVKGTTVEKDSELNYCKETCDGEEDSKEEKFAKIKDLLAKSQQKDISNIAVVNPVTPERYQHYEKVLETNSLEKSIDESNMKVHVDSCNNISEIPMLKDLCQTTKSVITNRNISTISSLTKSPTQLVSKLRSPSSKDLKQQETQTQKLVTKTLNKVQEEVKNRLTSVKTMSNQISSLFNQAMTEDSQCQTKFTEIIKLLSEINTLRKERKEKTSSISSKYFLITSVLRKLSEDMNYLNRLETLVQKHYNAKDMGLLSAIAKGKREGEAQSNRCFTEARKLKDAVQLLSSQEIILAKTFCKPLESSSPKRASNIGPSRIAPRKRQYTLDNRVYKRPHEDLRERIPKLGNARERNLTVRANDVVPTSPRECGEKSLDAKSTKFVSKGSQIKLDEAERPENDKFAGDLVLCPYDLLGRCNDDQCIYHHMSAATGSVAGQVRSPVRSSIKTNICNSNKPVHVDSKGPKTLDSNSLGSNDKAVISTEDRSESAVKSGELEVTAFSMEDFIIDTQGVKVEAVVEVVPKQEVTVGKMEDRQEAELEEEVPKRDVLITVNDIQVDDCDTSENLVVASGISEDWKVTQESDLVEGTPEHSEHVDMNEENSKCFASNRRRCKKRKSSNYLNKTLKKKKSIDNVSCLDDTGLIDKVTACDLGNTSEGGPKTTATVTTSENTSCCDPTSQATTTERDVTLSSPSPLKAAKKRRQTLPLSKQPRTREKRLVEKTPLCVRVLRSNKRLSRH